MKVLIVGSGGREHAIAWSVSQSKRVDKIYCAPGNGGIAEIAECVNITAMEFDKLAAFAKENEIDLTIIGMDDPLVGGIVDVFAKMPIVLKADGLALGKGVLICQNLQEAEAGVTSLMLDKQFGDAGNTIVIEDFMVGREASVLCFCDGTHIKPMTSAQDHKRAKDGDQGLNTGGMGTFSPSPFYTPEIQKFCEEQIYQPTMDAMKAEGRDFVGILFVGLMMTQDGPKVLEYNARFGDPEAQVVLPRMKNDIIDVIEACIDGKLDQVDLQFEDNAAVCVVLASDGYPEHYEKGKKITFLKDFASEDGYYAFHAGTKLTEDGLVTNGGRVLGITAKGATLKEARKNAYKATEWVTFDNKYMRNDIGKAIDEI